MVNKTEEHLQAKEQFFRFQYMRDNGHKDYVGRAKISEGFFDGDGQWDPAAKKLLDLEGRPAETINNILPKINNIVGHQIENRADIAYKPRDEFADPKSALTMTKIARQAHQANNYHDIETDVFEDGLITSRGFLTMDIEFKAPGLPGDIIMRKKHPHTILVDPDAMSYDPNDWRDWIEARWLSFNDIKRIFGTAKAKQLEHKQLSGESFDSIDTFGIESIRPLGFGQTDRRNISFATNKEFRDSAAILTLSREHKQATVSEWFIDPNTGDTSPVS